MFKRSFHLVALSVGAVFSALLFFAWQRQWIIVMSPPAYAHSIQQTKIKKECLLWYWHDEQWHHETQSLVWTENNAANVHYLINNWLTFIFQEGIISKKVYAQSAMLNQNQQQLFVSFDRHLFDKQQATHEKIMIIQGLIKTLAHVTTCTHINILLQHMPMPDADLDFTCPWPI